MVFEKFQFCSPRGATSRLPNAVKRTGRPAASAPVERGPRRPALRGRTVEMVSVWPFRRRCLERGQVRRRRWGGAGGCGGGSVVASLPLPPQAMSVRRETGCRTRRYATRAGVRFGSSSMRQRIRAPRRSQGRSTSDRRRAIARSVPSASSFVRLSPWHGYRNRRAGPLSISYATAAASTGPAGPDPRGRDRRAG